MCVTRCPRRRRWRALLVELLIAAIIVAAIATLPACSFPQWVPIVGASGGIPPHSHHPGSSDLARSMSGVWWTATAIAGVVGAIIAEIRRRNREPDA